MNGIQRCNQYEARCFRTTEFFALASHWILSIGFALLSLRALAEKRQNQRKFRAATCWRCTLCSEGSFLKKERRLARLADREGAPYRHMPGHIDVQINSSIRFVRRKVN